MSAAAVSLSAPLVREGNEYWQQLNQECRRQVETINTVVTEKGHTPDHRIEYAVGSRLRIAKMAHPSTVVTVALDFEAWGPVLRLSATGHQSEGSEFYPESWEMPIAMDVDDSVVAIYDEGKSFSPQELAAYLTQTFRRCFPGVCLCR